MDSFLDYLLADSSMGRDKLATYSTKPQLAFANH